MRKCSMHTSHPHGAIILQYPHGAIVLQYGRVPQVYARIPAHPFRIYGRIQGGIQPYTTGYTAIYSSYFLPTSMHF